MKETLLIMAVAWLLATAIGWVVTGLVDVPRRDALRPVASLVGLAVAILVLRWTALAVGVDVGVWFVLGVVVLLAVIATFRDRAWWRAPLRAVGWTVLVGAAAVIPAAITAGPTLAVGDSRVVQPSNNNDAFYYVTLAEWLAEHPATDIPDRTSVPTDTSTPPSYFPARSQLIGHLRIGQELVHAAVDVVVDRPGVYTWYPLTSLWVLLLPTAGYGLAVALRMRRLVGFGLGVATAVSSVTVFQLAAQNSDALLGICLMPFAAAAVVTSLGTRSTVPRWLAALLFVAAVGTYTEYLPVIGPALVVALLARRPRAVLAAVRRLGPLVAVAAVVGPLIWYDAVKSLLYLGGLASPTFRSVFNDVGSGAVLNRFIGTGPTNAGFAPERLTPVLVALLAVGVVGALAFSARRWFMLGLLAWPPVLAYYLVEVADPVAAYTQQRVVGLFLPLLLLVVAFGWDRLLSVTTKALAERPAAVRSGLRGAVAVVGVLGLMTWGVVNLRTDHRQGLPALAQRRHVDPTFADAAGWVDELGGPEGRDVDVLASDFFDQLWITDALRSEPGVQYPLLYTSYQGVTSYTTGRAARYLLVDRTTAMAEDPGMTVRSNDRFALVDLDRGKFAALSSGNENANGTWFVFVSPDVRSTITLRGRTKPDTGRHTGAQLARGQLPKGTLTADTTELTLPRPAAAGSVLNLFSDGLTFVPTTIVVDGGPS